MKYSENTMRACQSLLVDLQLPDSYMDTVQDICIPLAEALLEVCENKPEPTLISINGAQGTGKSTLTVFLGRLLKLEHNLSVTSISIDDFYLTSQQRVDLSSTIHPLLMTRGVPGTHDTALMIQTFEKLFSRQPCMLPVFDKARDDRCPQSQWLECKQAVDLILFEGWCNHSPWQEEHELIDPVNSLESEEDPDGTWRHYVNEQLKMYHTVFFSKADLSFMLQAPDFEHIFQWRQLQEEKLRKNTAADLQARPMDDETLKRFIQHYERITRHTLKRLPEQVDCRLPVSSSHLIEGIYWHHD